MLFLCSWSTLARLCSAQGQGQTGGAQAESGQGVSANGSAQRPVTQVQQGAGQDRNRGLPVLLVLGDRDQFTGVGALEERVRNAGGRVEEGLQGVGVAPGEAHHQHQEQQAGQALGDEAQTQMQLRVVPGADHFMWGQQLKTVAQAMVAWAAAHAG